MAQCRSLCLYITLQECLSLNHTACHSLCLCIKRKVPVSTSYCRSNCRSLYTQLQVLQQISLRHTTGPLWKYHIVGPSLWLHMHHIEQSLHAQQCRWLSPHQLYLQKMFAATDLMDTLRKHVFCNFVFNFLQYVILAILIT